MIDEEARCGDRHWGVGWAEQGDSEAFEGRHGGDPALDGEQCPYDH